MVKETMWDKLWWSIGKWLWRKSARQHPKEEVERRLSWMSLDYNFDLERERRREEQPK